MQSTKAGGMTRPDLGLLKIRTTVTNTSTLSSTPEATAVQIAECLFNNPDDGTALVLNACKQQRSSTNVFSAKVKSIRSDKAGNQHARVTQWYQGIRVVGAEIIVHMNRAGEIYRINGGYLPALEIAVQPAIDVKAALAIGMKHHQGGADPTIEQAPELVVYAKRLAYHYIISYQGPGGGQWHDYLDASNREIIFRFNNLQTR